MKLNAIESAINRAPSDEVAPYVTTRAMVYAVQFRLGVKLPNLRYLDDETAVFRGAVPVRTGDWIVFLGIDIENGPAEVMTDQRFHQRFEHVASPNVIGEGVLDVDETMSLLTAVDVASRNPTDTQAFADLRQIALRLHIAACHSLVATSED